MNTTITISRSFLGLDVADAYSYADSHEHREGVAAFLEKRKPRF